MNSHNNKNLIVINLVEPALMDIHLKFIEFQYQEQISKY